MYAMQDGLDTMTLGAIATGGMNWAGRLGQDGLGRGGMREGYIHNDFGHDGFGRDDLQRDDLGQVGLSRIAGVQWTWVGWYRSVLLGLMVLSGTAPAMMGHTSACGRVASVGAANEEAGPPRRKMSWVESLL